MYLIKCRCGDDYYSEKLMTEKKNFLTKLNCVTGLCKGLKVLLIVKKKIHDCMIRIDTKIDNCTKEFDLHY